jgi:hypothetical protein
MDGDHPTTGGRHRRPREQSLRIDGAPIVNQTQILGGGSLPNGVTLVATGIGKVSKKCPSG